MSYNLPFVGNLTADPYFTDGETPRANFRVAINEGERGTETEKSSFYDFTAFGSLAVNLRDSFKKGQRVVVIARAGNYSVDVVGKDGETKTKAIPTFKATFAGPDLNYASAVVTKNDRNSAQGSKSSSNPAPAASETKSAPAPAAVSAGGDDLDF